MTLEQKSQVARRFYDAMARRDIDEVVDCYLPSAAYDFSRSRATQRRISRAP